MIFQVPSDKSITHRAFIFAAMAKGKSKIHQPLLGRDTLATLRAFEMLGVKVSRHNDWIEIESNGVANFVSPQKEIDCENSGTTARLLTGLLASIEHLETELVGDSSLAKRPMDRVTNPLSQLHAHFEWSGERNFLPLKIKGRVLRAQTSFEVKSAQVKSALLLAACQIDGEIKINCEPGARRHTEEFLQWLGAKIQTREERGKDLISFHGPFTPHDFEVTIPGDLSSAAFFAALAVIEQGLAVEIPRIHADDHRGYYLKLMEKMGCEVMQSNRKQNGPFQTCDLQLVRKGLLKPIHVRQEEIGYVIDEIPILAVCCAFADGISKFDQVSELRVKESDRLDLTINLLSLAGVKAWVENDSLCIQGSSNRKKSFQFDPKRDHRMIMSAKILSMFSGAECKIADQAHVDVSFPRFFEELNAFKLKND